MLNLLSQLIPYKRSHIYTLGSEVHRMTWREFFGHYFDIEDALVCEVED